MSASRNLGVCNAAGEYIAFLDGDDVWLPQKLEEQVAILQSQPEVDMVYGPLQRWYSWNNNPADVANEDLYGFGKDGRHPYADSVVEPPKLLALFLEDEYFIPGGILIRSETLRRSGGYEASFRGMYEDAVALVKICLTARIYVSSTSWYKYRMHPRSCTHVAWLRREDHSAEQRYLKWVRRYLHQQKVADLEVWRAWRKTYWRCCLASFYRLLAACRHPIAYSKELLKRKDGKFALISSVLLVSSACRGAIHFSSLI
jgi:glycosyltransferase involved in cell wall biosynthesis